VHLMKYCLGAACALCPPQLCSKASLSKEIVVGWMSNR